MGELGGTVEYLYWSTRRTSRFIEDNSLSDEPATQTLTSPSLGWLPTFSRSKPSVSGKRPQIARVIEEALGQIAVNRFNAPGPIQYAKGTGTVVFSEFMHVSSRQEDRPTVIFTMADHSRTDRESVAVCLFGSMDNYLEYIQDGGPKTSHGWSSSAGPTVFNFIRSHGNDLGRPPIAGTAGEIAGAALQIAYSQGMHGVDYRCPRGMDRPWMRGYTYGDAREAEWLAQIYLDMTREQLAADGINTNDYAYDLPVSRILIGAPLWIRTPSPRSVRLYADCDDLDMSLYDPPEDRVYNPIFPVFRSRPGGKHKSKRRMM
jgi:hypothetical protein